MEKQHFLQAKIWLEGAAYVANLDFEGSNKYSVAVAMLVHAIIKANDALTYKYLNTIAQRHDDARRLFEELCKKNLIKSDFANYKQILQEVINSKAKAEYRAAYFSKADFDNLARKAEKFIQMAQLYI